MLLGVIHDNIMIQYCFIAINCPRVIVQDPSSVKTSDPGDQGRTFYFNVEHMDVMIGSNDWNNKKYDIIQHGSTQMWEGKVLLQKADDVNSQAYGTRTGGYQVRPGQWEPGDFIYLKNCDKPGKT